MKKFTLLRTSALTVVLGTVLAGAGSASAQTAAESDQGSSGEIIVTAQKRSENAQNVPISITALDQKLVAATGVTGTNDLRAAVPALNVTQAIGGFGLPRIRGIGSTGQGPSIENPVALYVDGVYVGASFAVLQSFTDTEQVAVLKGPQGTLFGRNATGGLIQITTQGPQDDLTIKAQMGYDNYKTMSTSAFVAGGLGQGVSMSLSGQYDTQGKGFGKNLFTGHDVQKADSWAMRGKLKFEMGADTSALASAWFMGRNAVDPAFINFGLNTLGQFQPTQITNLGGNPQRDIYANVDPLASTRQWGGSLAVDHDFGGVTIKSITGYISSKVKSYFDPDGSTVNQLVIDSNFEDRQFTQEINLLSKGDGPFKWVLGGFYMHDTAGAISIPGRTTGLFVFGNNGYNDAYNTTKLDSWSGFAEGTYSLGDATHLTAGIRYTSDHRTFSGYTVSFNGNIPGATPTTTTLAPLTQNNSKPTWRLSLDHRFSPELLGYISYNRGYRSGAFVVGTNPLQQLTPELVDAYEVGIKSDLMDRRVRLNLAAYYFNQSSVQVMQIISGVQNVYNAKGAKIYGLDGDISIKVSDNLKLFGGFNWNRSRYKSFTDAVIAIPFPVASTFTPSSFTYVDSVTGATVANTACLGTFGSPTAAVGGNCLLRGDASGKKLQNTPDITFNIGASLDIPSEIGKFSLTTNYYYNGGYVGDPDGRVKQAAFNTLDASVAWTNSSDHLTVRLWGKNLTNAFYRSQLGASNSGDNGYSGAPRTWGVTLGFKY